MPTIYPTRPMKPAANWDEVSGADLSLKAGYGITVASKVVTIAGSTAAFNGVLIDGGAASGDAVGYVNEGRIHVYVNANSENIAEEDFGKLMAGGIFVKATDENDEYVCKFLEACDGDGEYILADLDFKGHINSGDTDKYTLHAEIADPGDAAAIPVTASGIVAITTGAGAETNTLAIPTFIGQILGILHEVDGGGDRVITVASDIDTNSRTTISLTSAGQYVILRAVDIGGTLFWRVVCENMRVVTLETTMVAEQANIDTLQSDMDKYTLHTTIADPGDAAAIPVTASGIVHITTAAAETNTLAIPTFEGQLLCLFVEVYAVGDRVVTAASAINQAGNNTITLGAAEDMITLIAIDLSGTLYWRVLQNDGAALSTV